MEDKMAKKEFINLLEDSLQLMGWLAGRMRNHDLSGVRYKQYMRTLVRISFINKARLKDLAKYSDMSSSNLCTALKYMEQDGLILSQRDKLDRRNVWYSLKPAGERAVQDALKAFRENIAETFKGIDKKDEASLTEALRTMNEILHRTKDSYVEGN